MKTIGELHQAIEKSKGKDIHLRLRSLDHTKTVLNRNYFWLLQLNKYLSDKRDYLLPMENREKLDDFHIEFARHLHNYLASVKSLVDHTRVLKRKLNLDEQFEGEYEKQRKALLGTDTITFIQQLREYTQHYELLPSGIQVSISDNGNRETIILILATPSLQGFRRWNAASKRILQENPKSIDIYKLIEEYQVSVNKFYSWFYDEIEKIFKTELEEFDELGKEYKVYYEKMMQTKPK